MRGAAASPAEDPVELGPRRGVRRRADDLVDARVRQRENLGATEEVEDVGCPRLRAQLLERVHGLVDHEHVAVGCDALRKGRGIAGAEREDGGQRRKKVKSR